MVVTEFLRVAGKDRLVAHSPWLASSARGGEYFKGWNETQMAADRAAVIAFASGTTAEIETGAGMPHSSLWRRSAFRRINAPSKLLALQRIDVDRALSWQNDKEFHHLFPKTFLRARGVGSKEPEFTMRVKDPSECDRPRERRLARGAEALADRELLALPSARARVATTPWSLRGSSSRSTMDCTSSRGSTPMSW